MNWGVSRWTKSVHVRVLTLGSFIKSGPPRSVVGLHLGNIGHEAHVGENPTKVPTFLNQFVKAGGNYPATKFLTLGWVCSFKWHRWSSLTMYVLDVFETDLKRLGLHEAVRATCFGINISVPNFYAVLEMYCPASGTFFIPVSELRMAFHEMWEAFNLPVGSKPYEKYFTCTEELAQLKKDEPALYETYIELMCHFYIYLDLYPSRENVNNLKSWVEYLFSVVDGSVENLQISVSNRRIAKAMKAGEHEDIILEEDNGEYERGDTFLSFHRQASRTISR